ncbi:MAG: hypothetical protein RL033_6816 [Pseudomonadota bacterium]
MRSPSALLPPPGALSRFIAGACFGAIVLAQSAPAHAHFRLLNPPTWVEEDALGSPQKDAPCGGENGGVPTDVISTYRAGSTIQVTWQETVAHPGHFRIAVARDRSELVDPVVTTSNGNGTTGVSLTAEVATIPAYPVLVDGIFDRTSVAGPEEEPFKVEVTLPEFTCEKCTLQVVQFMANHLPGYFYHHCADVRLIAADAELPLGAGGSSTTAEPSDDVAGEEGGCSMIAGQGGSPLSAAALLLAGLAAALRRRSSN